MKGIKSTFTNNCKNMIWLFVTRRKQYEQSQKHHFFFSRFDKLLSTRKLDFSFNKLSILILQGFHNFPAKKKTHCEDTWEEGTIPCGFALNLLGNEMFYFAMLFWASICNKIYLFRLHRFLTFKNMFTLWTRIRIYVKYLLLMWFTFFKKKNLCRIIR